MTDQNSQFFAILTAVGEAKQANANALGVPWTFAQMGVGDANNTDPVPSRTQTKLINERRRAPLNQLSVDPKDASIIIAEQVIPPDVGGWWIREIGLYDAAGDLVAVANCAPSYKPLLAQGTGKTQVVRLNLVVNSTANVQLKIDPAVVLATREYVDSSVISVLPKNKVAGTYTKVRINDRGVVQDGSNPTTLEEYGIVNALKVGVTSYQRPILSGLGYGSAAESGGAIEIREAQEVGASNKSVAYAPRIMMHWTGVIAGDIAMDSLGQLQWKSQRLYHEGNFNPSTKADKATTLSGYGITDALPNRNPLANGNLDLHGNQIACASAIQQASLFQNAFWNGSVMAKHDPSKPAIGVTAIDGKAVVSRWTAEKQGEDYVTYELLDRSMEASAAELDEGTTAAKWVSVSGLSRFFGRLVKQSTESVVGILRVATQSEANGGIRDDVVITPKKLRWGFSVSFGSNSYIAFPTWLGGLIFQAGIGPLVTDSVVISFPIAFPNKCLSLQEHDVTGGGGVHRTFWQFRDLTTSGFSALNLGLYSRSSTTWTGMTTGSMCTWFAIGY